MSQKMIVLLVIAGLIASYEIYKYSTSKYHINKYVEKQGIKQEDTSVQEFKRNWKLGKYIHRISVKD
ncbi:hypothetical protein [Bacillus toyonensis]|uniref:DUF3139 domain-containing protein n=1 Tax=Bacillus toyonensis TaxID=155322 RepID=A0A2A8HA25_9BACI|nr:hypothetical protein [Bacillus toyonensis]PEQ00053.1 hypothetical protein CN585_23255 [Bacillus toyonensis]